MTLRVWVFCAAFVSASIQSFAAAAPDYLAVTTELEVAGNTRTGEVDHQEGGLTVRLEEQLTDRTHATLVATAAGRRSRPRDGHPAGTETFFEGRSRIETLTLSHVGDDFDVVAGNQVLSVGRADAFQLLDRFNGRDMCDFVRLDLDFKKPNPIVQVRMFRDDLTVRLIAAPFSADNDIADDRGSCADVLTNAGGFDFVPDPRNDSLEAWAVGAEVSLQRDEYELSLDIMSMREADFVLKTFPSLAKTRPRTLWLGGSGSISVGDHGVLRTEVALSPRRSFTLDPAETALLARTGVPTDGTDERWNLLVLLGYEFELADWTTDVQLFADVVDPGPKLLRNDVGSFASLRLHKTFMHARLSFALFSIYDLVDHDIVVRPELSYEASDRLTLTVGLVHYDDLDGEPGIFGTFEDRPQVFAGLRWRH